MKKVAVEQSLNNVKTFLCNQGYDVQDLEQVSQHLNYFDAIIVSGQNSNLLGMQDTNTKTSVIDARGMSKEEIHEALTNRLS